MDRFVLDPPGFAHIGSRRRLALLGLHRLRLQKARVVRVHLVDDAVNSRHAILLEGDVAHALHMYGGMLLVLGLLTLGPESLVVLRS